MTLKQIKNSQSAPDGSTYVTLTDGAGNLITPSIDANIVVGGTTITGGTNGSLLYDNAGTLGEDANLFWIGGELTGTTFVSRTDFTNGGYFSINASAGDYLGAITTQNAWFGSGSATNLALVAEHTIQIFPTNVNTSVLDITSTLITPSIPFSSLSLVDTTSSSLGVLNINSVPFLHGYPGTVSFSVFIGGAGNFTNSGSENVGIGRSALFSVTTGMSNMAIGRNALFSDQDGYNNTAIGTAALQNNISGFGNVAIGTAAGFNCTSPGNCLIGTNAGINLTGGLGFNVFIGSDSSGSGITTGSNNVIIGSITGLAAGTSNVIIIGDNINNRYLDYNYTTASIWTVNAGFNVLKNLSLTNTGGLTSTIGGTDGSISLILTGGTGTKALRFGPTATYFSIEGVANNQGSFQPLLIGGSTLFFQSNGSTVADYGSTTASVWTFAQKVAVPGGANPVLTTTSAVTSGAGALIGTLTNSPVTGNPTKWLPFNDNGTTRYIPAW